MILTVAGGQGVNKTYAKDKKCIKENVNQHKANNRHKKRNDYSTNEIIVYCIKSEYNKQLKTYKSYMRTEDENIYIIYTDTNIKNKWFYASMFNNGTSDNIRDDSIINIKPLK